MPNVKTSAPCKSWLICSPPFSGGVAPVHSVNAKKNRRRLQIKFNSSGVAELSSYFKLDSIGGVLQRSVAVLTKISRWRKIAELSSCFGFQFNSREWQSSVAVLRQIQ